MFTFTSGVASSRLDRGQIILEGGSIAKLAPKSIINGQRIGIASEGLVLRNLFTEPDRLFSSRSEDTTLI